MTQMTAEEQKRKEFDEQKNIIKDMEIIFEDASSIEAGVFSPRQARILRSPSRYINAMIIKEIMDQMKSKVYKGFDYEYRVNEDKSLSETLATNEISIELTLHLFDEWKEKNRLIVDNFCDNSYDTIIKICNLMGWNAKISNQDNDEIFTITLNAKLQDSIQIIHKTS